MPRSAPPARIKPFVENFHRIMTLLRAAFTLLSWRRQTQLRGGWALRAWDGGRLSTHTNDAHEEHAIDKMPALAGKMRGFDRTAGSEDNCLYVNPVEVRQARSQSLGYTDGAKIY